MPGTDWQSGTTLEVLRARADLLRRIRSFFDARHLMEVDTPILGRRGVTDLHIDCVEARVNGVTAYLQSSPEYFMKRLLAQGSGPIYSLGKVFRDGELGSRHRPEFTLLEWYRPGWEEQRLMTEVAELVEHLFGSALPVTRCSYGEVFGTAVGLDPHGASLEALRDSAGALVEGNWGGESRATLLDLLFSQVVEPALPEGLTLVFDYPACQAALARLGKDQNGVTVARRFEVFINRMELGNGYFELADADEQRARFRADVAGRRAEGRKPMVPDERLLAALASGLPDCAGVAIGVDRLLMQLLRQADIAAVMPFGGEFQVVE